MNTLAPRAHARYSQAFSPLAIRRDRRRRIEALIETLIEILDVQQGDPDLEEDNEDCCGAHEDIGTMTGFNPVFEKGPGDPADAEHDLGMSMGNGGFKWRDVHHGTHIEMIPERAPVTPFEKMIRR